MKYFDMQYSNLVSSHELKFLNSKMNKIYNTTADRDMKT